MPTTVNKISSLPALGTSPNGGSFLAVSQLVGPDYVLYKVTVSELLGTTITSLNGLTASSQTFATPGTSGTTPNWVSSGSTHTLNIPLASAASVTAGLISKAQYDAAIAPFITPQLQNLVVASPDGSSGTLSVRALTNTDLPTILPGKGGTGTTTAFTTGSVVFAGASGTYTQDNANLFWDNTNNYLGVGINSSLSANVHIKGYGTGNTFNLIAQNSSGYSILKTTNDGYILIGDENNQGVAIYSGNGTNAAVNITPSVNKNLILMSSVCTLTNGKAFIFKSQAGFDDSGSSTTTAISFDNFVYTNLQTIDNGFTAFEMNYQIAQIGGTGIHRGLYINPTITSASTTHRPLEITSGDVWIGTTNGKLKIGTIASPQTQFITTGEFGFSGVAPSAAQTGWIITNPAIRRAINVSTITHADLAEVVGTLLQDLIDKGLILA